MTGRTTVAVVLSASLLAGCAVQSDLMTPTGVGSAALRPDPGKALVVFLRPALVGYAIQAVVYDGDLAEGRTYFVEVVPRMGAWRARFSLRPLSATVDAGRVSSWLAEAKVVAPNADGQRWAERNQKSAMKKKAAYEPKWLAKANRPVLRTEDGSASSR